MLHVKRLVVLGTGTGVGKTWVTCALADAIGGLHPELCILPLKPVESGVGASPSGELATGERAEVDRKSPLSLTLEARATDKAAASDAEMLAAHGQHIAGPTLARFALPDPVSPHLAARRAGLQVDLTEVQRWISANELLVEPGAITTSDDTANSVTTSNQLPSGVDFSQHVQSQPLALRRTTSHRDTLRKGPMAELQLTLIETAGGVFSPLTATETNFDLAQHVPDAAWLLVAPDALGVLHDLTATLFMMRARGRAPNWVVLSRCRSDASSGTNAEELRNLGICAPIATLQADAPEGVLALATVISRWLLAP